MSMQLICTKTCGTCRKAVALLEDKGIAFEYREYRKDPLSKEELLDVLRKLGVGPREVLRTRDANKLGLRGDESDAELIDLMAEHPMLLQRPIGIVGEKAALGRPPEALLEIV
ncbi:arsenate reductase [Pseudenhygromyxa sp. WMMC2535]|uniref:arsenate reductase family protein n=1 Tax=Pseudenhygromyxa sp. WMMC2535 TaxID=2712867 RepID=UPI001557DB35|nr:ArsC/Spx/MgsR family protein [Pseudenhygromyxa sp. WMMC2535]NVB38255.1 arsenate reductase [Pseudenhygromyxa sp. WMMC2535]